MFKESNDLQHSQYILSTQGYGTIHLRRRQIFTIFDPYPPPSANLANFWPLPPKKCRRLKLMASPSKKCRRVKWMVPTRYVVYFLKLGIILLTHTQENLTPIKKLPDYINFSEKKTVFYIAIGSATLRFKSEITLKYVLCVVWELRSQAKNPGVNSLNMRERSTL